MNKRIKASIIMIMLSTILPFLSSNLSPEINWKEMPEIVRSDMTLYETEFIPNKEIKIVDPVMDSAEDIPSCYLTSEEIELIALVVMAESECEPEDGKRLVIDTILNRMDSPYFPNTIYEVIYQKNQFTSMTNGRADRCYPKEDICNLVIDELDNRTNDQVIFFRTTRFSDYGTPMYQVGHHYFSSY